MTIEDVLTLGADDALNSLLGEMKTMSAHARARGLIGIGMVILLCITPEAGATTVVMPLHLEGELKNGSDPPPSGWMEKMFHELNAG